MRQYLPFLFTAAFGLAVAGGMIALSILFGPSKKTPVKQEPFECGMPPAMEPRGMARVNFYLVAILFVMFDIEIVFLYPWAVSFRQLGPSAFYAIPSIRHEVIIAVSTGIFVHIGVTPRVDRLLLQIRPFPRREVRSILEKRVESVWISAGV